MKMCPCYSIQNKYRINDLDDFYQRQTDLSFYEINGSLFPIMGENFRRPLFPREVLFSVFPGAFSACADSLGRCFVLFGVGRRLV